MLRSKLRSKWFTTASRIWNKELMRYKHTCTYLARLGTAVIGTLTVFHAGPIWSSASRGGQKWSLQFGPPEKWPGPLRHLQSSRFHGVPCAWNFPEKREKGLANRHGTDIKKLCHCSCFILALYKLIRIPESGKVWLYIRNPGLWNS